MIVILDTNVVVSGLLTPRGGCARILRALTEARFSACACDEIIGEYQEVLARPRIAIPPDDVREFLACVDRVATPPPLDASKFPDPDDVVFLATARACLADYLVTGNMKHYPPALRRGVRVVTPAEFLKHLKV